MCIFSMYLNFKSSKQSRYYNCSHSADEETEAQLSLSDTFQVMQPVCFMSESQTQVYLSPESPLTVNFPPALTQVSTQIQHMASYLRDFVFDGVLCRGFRQALNSPGFYDHLLPAWRPKGQSNLFACAEILFHSPSVRGHCPDTSR